MKYVQLLNLLEMVSTSVIGINKIINGAPVQSIDDYPWLAGLQKVEDSAIPICGGTVFDAKHIITAAHCSVGVIPTQFQFVAHRLDVTKPSDEEKGLVFKVKKVIVHPQYDDKNENVPFDIAVWEVELVKGDFSIIKALPKLDDGKASIVGQMATVAGWGDTVDGAGLGSPILREIEVPIRDLATCKKSFPEIQPSSFCAGSLRGGKDSCQGDSGGPLFLKTNPPTLVGVVSYGRECGSSVGVYANIAVLNPWLRETMGINNNTKDNKNNAMQYYSTLTTNILMAIVFGLII
ncbi:hypothetical protein HDV02_005059 [Globomyces sp. JEL0801]|nr:hypothetical protein HDV02_005059 [Globomyces sp. JEL0801]